MRKNTIFTLTLILAIVFTLILAGCDNLTTPTSPTTPTTPTTPSTPILALPATVKPVLGHGYDITSHYAYSPDIKPAVLDLDKLLEAQRVQEDLNLRSGVFETITGKDINEYMRGITEKVSFSAKASFLKLASFSAEVGANFGDERTTKAEYAFTTSTSRIVKGAYNIGNKNRLDEFFTQNFATDIVSLSPQQLINKYGTHVMLGAVLGARADYHLSVKKKEQNNITNLGAYAKAKVEAKFLGTTAGASASTEVDTKYAQYFYTQETVEKTRVFGGKEEYGQHIQNKQDYDKWIESIEGREIWVDYYPNSLVPLSDLITDKSRSDALAQAIENYCRDKEIIVVKSSYTLKIEQYPNSWGTFTMDGENKSSGSYYENTPIPIKAEAKNGYKFIGWTVRAGDAKIANPENASTTVTFNANSTIRANYLYASAKYEGEIGKFSLTADDDSRINISYLPEPPIFGLSFGGYKEDNADTKKNGTRVVDPGPGTGFTWGVPDGSIVRFGVRERQNKTMKEGGEYFMYKSGSPKIAYYTWNGKPNTLTYGGVK